MEAAAGNARAAFERSIGRSSVRGRRDVASFRHPARPFASPKARRRHGGATGRSWDGLNPGGRAHVMDGEAIGRRPCVAPAFRHGLSGSTIPARGAMMGRTARRRQRGPARAMAAVEGEQEPRARQGPAPAPARDRRTWLVAIPLVLLVLAAFLPALGNGFVDWDDELNFVKNRAVPRPGVGTGQMGLDHLPAGRLSAAGLAAVRGAIRPSSGWIPAATT